MVREADKEASNLDLIPSQVYQLFINYILQIHLITRKL